jgi:hypothetical protein
MLPRFEYDDSGAFAKGHAAAITGKRPTGRCIEEFEGIEAHKTQARERIDPACQAYFNRAESNQVGDRRDRGRTRTTGEDGTLPWSLDAEVLRQHAPASPADAHRRQSEIVST